MPNWIVLQRSHASANSTALGLDVRAQFLANARPGAIHGGDRCREIRYRFWHRSRRYHMDNPVAALLQRFEQSRKRHGGCRVNIMQQQNAAAFGFETLHGTLHNLLWSDAFEPVIGNNVSTPIHKCA